MSIHIVSLMHLIIISPLPLSHCICSSSFFYRYPHVSDCFSSTLSPLVCIWSSSSSYTWSSSLSYLLNFVLPHHSSFVVDHLNSFIFNVQNHSSLDLLQCCSPLSMLHLVFIRRLKAKDRMLRIRHQTQLLNIKLWGSNTEACMPNLLHRRKTNSLRGPKAELTTTIELLRSSFRLLQVSSFFNSHPSSLEVWGSKCRRQDLS